MFNGVEQFYFFFRTKSYRQYSYYVRLELTKGCKRSCHLWQIVDAARCLTDDARRTLTDHNLAHNEHFMLGRAKKRYDKQYIRRK